MSRLRREAHDRNVAVRAAIIQVFADGLAVHRVEDFQRITGRGATNQFDRDALASPRRDHIVDLAVLPAMALVAVVSEGAAPMPRGEVAGAGESQRIAGPLS